MTFEAYLWHIPNILLISLLLNITQTRMVVVSAVLDVLVLHLFLVVKVRT